MEDPVYLEDGDVIGRMLTSERYQDISPYFNNGLQLDFNDNDRRELAIWMRDVCLAEECQPDIFPLSMTIVDRFLSFVITKKNQLQLLGSVALLLASKLRQTSQIPAQHLVYYTQDLITLRELWDWELLVLTALKWQLALITPMDYLDILIKRLRTQSYQSKVISDIEESTQRMIMDSYLDFTNSLYRPSMIAWVCFMQNVENFGLCVDQMDDAMLMLDMMKNNNNIRQDSEKQDSHFCDSVGDKLRVLDPHKSGWFNTLENSDRIRALQDNLICIIEQENYIVS